MGTRRRFIILFYGEQVFSARFLLTDIFFSKRLQRDQRLDFFRGVTMMIIFIAHTPGNSWNDWIPARFGFSSGTELFVFCSGCASAGAFGRVFQDKGWFSGTVKVARRIWQIYWVQLCLVLTSIALAYFAQAFVGASAFQRFMPIQDFGSEAIVSLMILSWLPDFLDILPMYIVILALLPWMEAFSRIHQKLPLLVSASLWAFVQLQGLNLSGNPWSRDVWFLNPFAWQFCFMLGYSFGLKRVMPPAWHQRQFVLISIFVLILGFVLSFQPLIDSFSILRNLQAFLIPEDAKTNLAFIRLLHFLCLAYLVLGWVAPLSDRLNQGPGKLIVFIGQQSLATFVMSIVAAQVCGYIFQWAGSGSLITLGVNLFGFLILLVTAYAMTFFKREPWSNSAVKGAKVSGIH